MSNRTEFTNRFCRLKPGASRSKGPAANYGKHRMNCRYMIDSIKYLSTIISKLFIRFSFFSSNLILFDNARVFQRVLMNFLNEFSKSQYDRWSSRMQSADIVLSYSKSTLAASCVW